MGCVFSSYEGELQLFCASPRLEPLNQDACGKAMALQRPQPLLNLILPPRNY